MIQGFIRPITPTSGNAADAMLKALPNAAINTINFIGNLGAATGGGEYTPIPTLKYQNEGLGLAAELAMTGPFVELAAVSRVGRVGAALEGTYYASFGTALTNDYRATFFAVYPELKGQVVVHHAVEQQVLNKFPSVVTKTEMHSLENLRGIPNEINNTVHLGDIRVEWNRFYKPFIANGTSPTQTQFLQKATEIDLKYGGQFKPPVGKGN